MNSHELLWLNLIFLLWWVSCVHDFAKVNLNSCYDLFSMQQPDAEQNQLTVMWSRYASVISEMTCEQCSSCNLKSWQALISISDIKQRKETVCLTVWFSCSEIRERRTEWLESSCHADSILSADMTLFKKNCIILTKTATDKCLISQNIKIFTVTLHEKIMSWSWSKHS